MLVLRKEGKRAFIGTLLVRALEKHLLYFYRGVYKVSSPHRRHSLIPCLLFCKTPRRSNKNPFGGFPWAIFFIPRYNPLLGISPCYYLLCVWFAWYNPLLLSLVCLVCLVCLVQKQTKQGIIPSKSLYQALAYTKQGIIPSKPNKQGRLTGREWPCRRFIVPCMFG